MPRPCGVPACFLQLDASLRQRERLLVAMLHQRDVGLVAAHRREHVAGFDEQRSRSAWRRAAIASSSRPSCASVTPESECTIAR